MGNIVQCCQALSHYFKCKDAAAQGEVERSALLSSEESECESPCLPGDLEDDLLPSSTGIVNPALEPEHFLFPDIILSSNLGGDVTLVEPMVCLLVSEEEEEGRGEGMRVDERRNDGRERSSTERSRGYSEVETQTEAETQIGTGVQTQTESQAEVETQTDILVCNNTTVARQVRRLRNTKDIAVDVREEHEILKEEDVFLEVGTGTQTSRGRHSETVTTTPSEKQHERILGLEIWSDVEVFAEEKVEKNKLASREEAQKGNQIFELKTEQKQKLGTGEETQRDVKDRGGESRSEFTSVMLSERNANNMDDNIAPVASDRMTKPSTNSTDGLEECDPAERHEDLTPQRRRHNEQMAEATEVSDHNVNEKGHENAEHNQCQENLHPSKKEEDGGRAGLQHVLGLETVLPQAEEEGAELKQMTLFLVDRLFLAAPYGKGVVLTLLDRVCVCSHHIQPCLITTTQGILSLGN